MSILSVNEVSGARSTENEKGETEYTRTFKVVTSAANIGAIAVRTATGIPRVGDYYLTATEQDTGSLCKRVEPQQEQDNPRLWIVRADYGAPSDGDEAQRNPNPLLRPAVLTWGFNKSSRVVWKDANGKGITNSAGEYFDPPPEMDDSRPTLSITRNEAAFNPGIATDYQDAVNSDSFLGFAPGQVKVAGISGTSQTENNVAFWSVGYEFEFRREGWQLSILDQGRNQRILQWLAPILQRRADNAEPIQGMAVSDPVPLNGAGGELINPGPNTVIYRNFEVYKSKAFAPLGLP